MAKATPSPIATPTGGSPNEHNRPESRVPSGQVSFVNDPAGLVLRAKPQRKKTPSEAQSLQRLYYSDCDCLWKNRDELQASQWEKYIEEKGLKTELHLDSYRLFMRACLNWDFVIYFTEYFWSVWVLDSITSTPDGYRVCVHMGSLSDETAPEFALDPFSPVNRII